MNVICKATLSILLVILNLAWCPGKDLENVGCGLRVLNERVTNLCKSINPLGIVTHIIGDQ